MCVSLQFLFSTSKNCGHDFCVFMFEILKKKSILKSKILKIIYIYLFKKKLYTYI